jgi:hypothetical protein
MGTLIKFLKNLFSSSTPAKKPEGAKTSHDYAADIEDELTRPTNRGG